MRFGIINGLTALTALLIILTACETVDNLNPFGTSTIAVPRCPSIKFLKDTDKIIVYKKGPGRDISDVKFEAELKSFIGECEYFGDIGSYDKVVVTLQVGLDITRGPAAKKSQFKLSYFVAIPEFFPNPKGKVTFDRLLQFPPDRNSMSILDKAIEVTIPLNKNRPGPKTKVLIGFNLEKSQLELNRAIKGKSVLGQ